MSSSGPTRHLARAAGGQALRPRRIPLAAAVGAREPRPRRRLRGLLPAPERPPAAAPHPRGAGGQGEDLDADRRGRDRDGDPDPRPRQQQDELLRDRLGAHPAVHRPRDRPARLRLLLQAPSRALRRGLVRPGGHPVHGRHGDRPRPPRRQLPRRASGARGRPPRARSASGASACSARRWPGAGAATSSRW